MPDAGGHQDAPSDDAPVDPVQTGSPATGPSAPVPPTGPADDDA